MPGRNALIVRVLRMHRLLSQRPWSVQALALEIGAQPRTIYRDLAALQEAHIPIAEERDGKRRRYRVMAS